MSEAPFRFTPCHERWETMSPSERGRLCAKCSTEIIDFRNSTEAEIEHTVTTSPVKICGYYSIAQFQKPGSRLAAAATAATLAIALPTVTDGVQQPGVATAVPDVAPADTTVVRGIVRDSVSRAPLVGVVITVGDGRSGAVTDHNGQFRLVLDRKLDRPVSLLAQFIGYESRIIEVTTDDPAAEAEFALPGSVIGIVEVVVTSSDQPLVRRKPSFWRRIWNFLGG